jgi:hypothetical protein
VTLVSGPEWHQALCARPLSCTSDYGSQSRSGETKGRAPYSGAESVPASVAHAGPVAVRSGSAAEGSMQLVSSVVLSQPQRIRLWAPARQPFDCILQYPCEVQPAPMGNRHCRSLAHSLAVVHVAPATPGLAQPAIERTANAAETPRKAGLIHWFRRSSEAKLDRGIRRQQ